MIKFSITKLEDARVNPVAFAKLLLDGQVVTRGFGYPKSLRWLNAVTAYHASSKIGDAYVSIENALSNRKDTAANRRELEKLLTSLSDYEKQIKNLSFHLIKAREPIDLPLTKKLRIGGQIPLIYMKEDEGYAAYFISKENADWQSELKYPILQNYISKKVFKTDPKQVDIGYIDYLTGQFHQECFSAPELKGAESELKEMATKISKSL